MTENTWTDCPACGEKTLVKLKTIHPDWNLVDKIFVCTLCGAELGRPDAKKNADARDDGGKLDRLSALLGGGELEKPTLAPGESHGRFCRNCAHFVANPFKAMCSRHRRETDPGGECDCFTPPQCG